MLRTETLIGGRDIYIHSEDVEVFKDSPGGEVRYVDVCGTCDTSCNTDDDGYSVCCMDRADHLMWRDGNWYAD